MRDPYRGLALSSVRPPAAPLLLIVPIMNQQIAMAPRRMAKLSLLVTFAFPFLSMAQTMAFCPGLNESAQGLAASRFGKYEHAFVNTQTKPIFFVGLWSRMEERDRRQLSEALSKKPDVEMIKSTREIMVVLSKRLSDERQELTAWVQAKGLASEIEVQTLPDDGSFLLVKSSRAGLQSMLCASAAGILPAILTEMSN